MSVQTVIHQEAKIANDVKIGPFCYIEEDVSIGEGTIIEPHVTIYNGSRIGKNCHIFPGAVIGGAPQDKSFSEEHKTTVEIGDRVVIREHCTLHRGTTDKFKTVIGNDCFLMAYVHVAHDCIVSDFVTIANGTNLGGHVEVGEFANIGGMVGIHQFSKIGKQTMVAAGITIRTDVPPYVKAARDPATFSGVNTIGLRRKGFVQEQIDQIIDIYRILFVMHSNQKNAIDIIQQTIQESVYKEEILTFIHNSKRGLIKGIR